MTHNNQIYYSNIIKWLRIYWTNELYLMITWLRTFWIYQTWQCIPGIPNTENRRGRAIWKDSRNRRYPKPFKSGFVSPSNGHTGYSETYTPYLNLRRECRPGARDLRTGIQNSNLARKGHGKSRNWYCNPSSFDWSVGLVQNDALSSSTTTSSTSCPNWSSKSAP